MGSPIATGSSTAEITAAPAEASVAERPAAPSTAAATVPGPVVESPASPSAACAQDQPQEGGRHTSCRYPPENTCGLRDHERQHRTEQCPSPAETLTENQPGQKARHDADHDILKAAPLECGPTLCIVRGLVCAFDGFENRFRSRPHARRNITHFETRDDLVANDAGRPQIGQRPLKAIADFNSELSLLECDEQQDAVVGAFLTQLPRRGDTMGILFERLSLEGRKDQDRHLIAGFYLVRLQLCTELLRIVRRQDSGKVHYTARQGWDVQCRDWQ